VTALEGLALVVCVGFTATLATYAALSWFDSGGEE
jgi:hypothetical protein